MKVNGRPPNSANVEGGLLLDSEQDQTGNQPHFRSELLARVAVRVERIHCRLERRIMAMHLEAAPQRVMASWIVT
jgi:hypothetical protein